MSEMGKDTEKVRWVNGGTCSVAQVHEASQ